MCGIAGLFSPRAALPAEVMAATVANMTSTLALRGPDGQGGWVDNAAGCALGHRRLSILDLSEQGAQPMHSACERYVIVFNGEVYNHRELRDELEHAGAAPQWRGHSDTEIMLAAIAHWGLHAATSRFTGMFVLTQGFVAGSPREEAQEFAPGHRARDHGVGIACADALVA